MTELIKKLSTVRRDGPQSFGDDWGVMSLKRAVPKATAIKVGILSFN